MLESEHSPIAASHVSSHRRNQTVLRLPELQILAPVGGDTTDTPSFSIEIDRTMNLFTFSQARQHPPSTRLPPCGLALGATTG
jgi:hypothetical protein